MVTPILTLNEITVILRIFLTLSTTFLSQYYLYQIRSKKYPKFFLATARIYLLAIY